MSSAYRKAATVPATQVIDNPSRERFELYEGVLLVGVLDYRRGNGRLNLTHTEIERDRRGTGLGDAVVTGALEIARARGDRVTPECSFVVDFISRHPEYADLAA